MGGLLTSFYHKPVTSITSKVMTIILKLLY
jgi:hypothetical protein